ncbi:Gfo/Idh/MocA family oxidoreductase [Edaphobacter aggregans]|uniref:Gfo/Idh/MocA family oxidoreductase n=1 Tax=Edaphobacter aggregans TaxID=570835 RepID=UPI00054E4DE3|nr:Gfo/Idh/MocA family oxidoreductase [Edaphobacter aggregans]
MLPKIAVIGNGYWGKNLVRNFHALGVLACVCDQRAEALQDAHAQCGVDTCTSPEVLLSNPEIQGVAIAAPAVQHYQLVKDFLLAGKDVYVEKPLALLVDEGKELADIAEKKHRILMVGHILHYHPAILKLKELLGSGELGRIQYIYSSRLNWGKLRTEENILWSFAPHDISAILYLLDEMPVSVTATGGSYINPKIHDTTLAACEFQSGVKAHIFVSWLHPFKEQRMVIVGEQKTAVFDDVESERKLVIYPHRIDWVNRLPAARKDEGRIVLLPAVEPLRQECEHFIESMITRTTPRTNAREGVRVLQVLDACERSLHAKAIMVKINETPTKYCADPTAVIDSGCEIGSGSKIWHFSHLMAGSRIGRDCNLGQNVVISPDVKIGDRVKIQNNVSVYTGVELEDDVFCGPSMVFTNVINPRSHVERKHEYRRTLVKQGASIGANATILCGVTLGQYSFVAAGAVVTHDVPDYGLVMGVPATLSGWVCVCGVRLAGVGRITCAACGRDYDIDANYCRGATHPSVCAA